MQPTEGGPASARRRAGWLRVPAIGAAALALFWLAAASHLDRACTVLDTPYLPLCPAPPDGPAAVKAQLRERVAGSPGDSWAWMKWLVAARAAPPDGVLQAASMLAPNHAAVQRWRAAKALEQGDYAKGIELLVQMVDARGSADASLLLAQLAATPQGLDLLRPHLAAGRRWLPAVLSQMAALKAQPGLALPLVAAAMDAGVLPDETRRAYMRTLKNGGQWLDAYGLWLAHRKDAVPLLYNGGFDQPLELDGFDWEFTSVPRSQAGVVYGQGPVALRGFVLELEFTGRRINPTVLWQHVFVPPGSYRLAGEFASKLRSESGLTVNVACSLGARKVLAGSPALAATGGAWRRFQVDFTVTPDCGPVATIQLVPTAAYEAVAGMRGQFSLDAISLVRTTSQ